MELPDQTAQQSANAIGEAFKRVAKLPATGLVSEEDAKNKVVLPMLRALGYEDADFNYERRTGRGYVDVVVEQFPTGIVVEAKAPRTRLGNYLGQLETYVFHKHGRDRATVAILTDGESFNIYGVTEALFKGSLENYQILSFQRSELGGSILVSQLNDLLGKQNNQKGTIIDAIATFQRRRDRLKPIETELRSLSAERERIDARIQELQTERTSILGFATADHVDAKTADRVDSKATFASLTYEFPAMPHILRLLSEQKAHSKAQSVDRKWLDQQLVEKVEEINTDQAVSWGLIELKKTGKIDYEGKPIKKVWLK